MNSSTDRQVCTVDSIAFRLISDTIFYGATYTTKQQLRHIGHCCQRNLNTPQNSDGSYIEHMRADVSKVKQSVSLRVPPSDFERVLSACRAPMLNAPP